VDFSKKFARHLCAISGKQFLGAGVGEAGKSGKNRSAEDEIDLTG
jgi:hypothetical protein